MLYIHGVLRGGDGGGAWRCRVMCVERIELGTGGAAIAVRFNAPVCGAGAKVR